MTSSNNNDNNQDTPTPLPRVKRKGLPLWVFRIMKCLMTCCPFDAYVAFPLMFLIIIAVLGFFSSINEDTPERVGMFVGIAIASCLLMWLWLKWARSNPKVPQEEDVYRISVSAGMETWPAAPVAPLRNQLKAKNSSWFKDELGRRVLLRGINVQGSCKLPYMPIDARKTQSPNTSFENYKDVSFVGRPFPLDECDFHFARLRSMGFTFCRFLITWEAIEHAGPGIYDTAYLEYLKEILQKCGEHGISVFVDFHQDVWSRWTGGDGAPAWTLEKVGFNLATLDASAAAITQQHSNKKEYPKMIWNSNNFRLGAGTMWTLFFAGNDFAPNTLIDDMPVQDYLQSHYLGAMEQVAIAVKDCDNVVGFDILNEPSVGFVGLADIRDIGPNSYFVGWRVDAWSGMKLGAGETCTVDYFSSFMYLDGKRNLNTTKTCAWKNGPSSCVWHQNGVWKLDENDKPQLLKPFYFSKNPTTGEEIDFLHDYGLPFWKTCATTIRQHIPDAVVFAEPILDMTDPSKVDRPVLTDDEVGAGYVWADHYYDGITLMTKSYSKFLGMDSQSQKPSIGMKFIEKSYGKGISVSNVEASGIGSGGVPVLIGETGIPFDMNTGDDKKPIFFGCHQPKTAFETGNFSTCTNALDRSLGSMDESQVSYTIWCYQPDNTNEYGDGWNGEDLSLFSKSQVKAGDEDDLYAGGRSLLAAIRPYPQRVAGDVSSYEFDLYRKDRRFDLKFTADHSLETNETIVFLPKYQYPRGVNVEIKSGGGSYEIDWDTQSLTYRHAESSTVNHIHVTKILAPKKSRENEGGGNLQVPMASSGES